MTKSSPHFLLFSLLSAGGHFHVPSASPKIWCLSKKKYHNWRKKLIRVLKRRRRKRKNPTEHLIQSLIIGLVLVLVLLAGCENGARHSLELTEPTDHTKGDDGGEIKYKIIWGSTKHKD